MTIEVKEDAWRWRVIEVNGQKVCAEGECETYTAARVAMMLSGVTTRPTRSRQYRNEVLYWMDGRQVWLEFWRLGDGYIMREWGTVGGEPQSSTSNL